MRHLIIIAAAATSVLALGSCATMSEDQCLAGDWGRQGYADGRSGQALSRLEAHTEACAKYGVVPDARSYYSAREDGLREYCTPARGFQVGREGSSYADVCPPQLEADFLPAYLDGQVVHAAEQALSAARSSVASLGSRAEALDEKIRAKRAEMRASGLTDERARRPLPLRRPLRSLVGREGDGDDRRPVLQDAARITRPNCGSSSPEA